MFIRKLSLLNTHSYIGIFLFWLFIFIVMIDPTNTIFHKKDIVFILVVAYNMVVFKPDFSKLLYIILMVCAFLIPWLISLMMMTPYDPDEALAVFKSISPILLLLWVRNYDLVSLSKGPVVICCIISTVTYIAIISNPMIESAVWLFMQNTDFPITMSRRQILGFEVFGFYLKSFVSFLFVVAYYMLVLMNKTKLNVRNVIFMLFILFAFFVSGTRSTMLAPFFLFVIIAFRVYKNSKYMKYVMLPVAFIVAVAFILVLVAAMTETDEYSNAIKYGHLTSYATLFDENPLYLILGQGPGTSFYSEGFDEVVFKTEWSYLELLRCLGIFAVLIIYVFWKPLFTFWKYRNDNDFNYCMFWTYLAYLLIAGTNPLLISSTGMITLLMAYSYEDKLKRMETKTV